MKTAVQEARLSQRARDLLIDRFAPPSVIVNGEGMVLFVQGRTGLYLEPATGEQPGSILDMAREGLRDALAVALRQAAAQDGPAVRHNVLVKSNGDWARIDLTVWKITSPESLAGLLLISFMPSAPKKRPHERKTSTNPDAERVIDLEQELQYSKESLQTTVEELETSNEELKSTNEELASTNEELQSTNEELETSKEEMQSLNEELTTVNNELQSKVEELAEANSDIQNLLDSTDIATVFLDENLCIKRYTQKAKDVVKVIQSDVGRPIGDLAVALEDGENIEELSRKVLDNLQETAKEVRSKDGQWYLMRVRPYRTTQNVIDGVTVIFLPIDRFKRRENEIRSQWDFYESIFDTMRDPVLVLDAHLTVVCANDRFYTVFQYGRKSMEGKKVYDIAKGQWNASGLRKLLEEVLPADHAFEDFELEADFGKAGHRKLVLNGRKLDPSAGRPGMIVLAMEDVTPETYYP